MNNMRLYAIYDRVAQQYQAPFAAINDGTAIRMFVSNCKHPELAYIAGDLDLFYLGEMIVSTGEIVIDGKPTFLHRISEKDVIQNGD